MQTGLATDAIARLAAVTRGGGPCQEAGGVSFEAEAAMLVASLSAGQARPARPSRSAVSLSTRALHTHTTASAAENSSMLAAGTVAGTAPSVAAIDAIRTTNIRHCSYCTTPRRTAVVRPLSGRRSSAWRTSPVLALGAGTFACCVRAVAVRLVVFHSTPAPRARRRALSSAHRPAMTKLVPLRALAACQRTGSGWAGSDAFAQEAIRSSQRADRDRQPARHARRAPPAYVRGDGREQSACTQTCVDNPAYVFTAPT
jgi:hypothetical protein